MFIVARRKKKKFVINKRQSLTITLVVVIIGLILLVSNRTILKEPEYSIKLHDEEIEMSAGRMMAVSTFQAFFYPNPDTCNLSSRESMEDCKDNIFTDDSAFDGTLREVETKIKEGAHMSNYSSFSEAVYNKEIQYTFILSTICGAFLLYVILNFCFDVALRVVKLMFYQITAPIPVICRIIPFGTLKDVFKNWLKQTTSTFFEVFVRIAIMNFGVLLIKLMNQAFVSSYNNGTLSLSVGEIKIGGVQFLLAKLLLQMGIIIFMRNKDVFCVHNYP